VYTNECRYIYIYLHSFLTNAIEVQNSSGVMYLHTSVHLGGYSAAFSLVYGYISILISVVSCAICSLAFISFWDYSQYFYILTTCSFVMLRLYDPLEFHMSVFTYQWQNVHLFPSSTICKRLFYVSCNSAKVLHRTA
jgi:hypothetical protein